MAVICLTFYMSKIVKKRFAFAHSVSQQVLSLSSAAVLTATFSSSIDWHLARDGPGGERIEMKQNELD